MRKLKKISNKFEKISEKFCDSLLIPSRLRIFLSAGSKMFVLAQTED